MRTTLCSQRHLLFSFLGLLLLTSVSGSAPALSQTGGSDAEKIRRIFAATDSVLRGACAGELQAEYVTFTEGEDTIRAAGRVTYERAGEENKLKAKLRLEFEDGSLQTWDGTMMMAVHPASSKVTLAHDSVGGSNVIEGSIRGSIVVTQYTRGTNYVRELSDTTLIELAYLGIESINGVPCHAIRCRYTGNDLVSDYTSDLYLGVDDYLTYRERWSYIYNGRRDVQQYTVSNVRLNVPLKEGEFSPIFPEGFEVTHYAPKPRPELLPVGSAAPGWRLPTPEGDSLSLSDLRGKVVLLDFWYANCGPCMMAVPALQELHEEFGARGVEVIGVHCCDPADVDPVNVMNLKGATYSLALKGDSVVMDYKVSGFPTLYVIDAEGNILSRDSGYGRNTKAELAEIIEAYLREHRR